MNITEIFEEIANGVLDGDGDIVAEKVQDALDAGASAGEILNNALLAGMGKVGVLFRDGEMFVPEVLVSAEAMQEGVDIVKPLLIAGDIKKLGKVLLVTVAGDMHDIGIKLVAMMLEGAGFEVNFMGVDKSTDEIIAKVKEYKPDILGMSAMLTTTMSNMPIVIDALKEEALCDGLIVMIGGAPTSPGFAKQIGANYSADASDAVNVAKALIA